MGKEIDTFAAKIAGITIEEFDEIRRKANTSSIT